VSKGEVESQDQGRKSEKPYRCRRRTSELQQLYLNKFKEASKYARTLLRDPDKYEYYTKAHGQANPINSTDWVFKLQAPPEKGSTFIVTATDAFGVPTIRQLRV